MVQPQSNNPFRTSMLPPDPPSPSMDSNAPQLSPTPTIPPPILYKSPSTTTTIAEEPRPSEEVYLANTPTVTTSQPSIHMSAVEQEKPKVDDVVITIHKTVSQTSVPQQPSPCADPSRRSMGAGGDRRSLRCSMQIDECAMWPARREMQKEHARKKRLWIYFKIIAAIIIVGGAVAVGLGISTAVRNARN